MSLKRDKRGMMTPDDQNVNSANQPNGGDADPPRPTPWMPPEEANSNESQAVPAETPPINDQSNPAREPSEDELRSLSNEARIAEPAPAQPQTPIATTIGSMPSGYSATTVAPATTTLPDNATSTSTASPPLTTQVPAPTQNPKLLKIVLLVALLVAVVAAGYFGYRAWKNHTQTSSVNNAINAAVAKKVAGATDMSALNNVKFAIPSSALATLSKQPSANPNADYYATADGKCLLIYGTGDATQVKGSNISQIVNNYLNSIRAAGATVAAPTAGDPRVFKDTTNAGKQYSMPSLNFTFTQGNEYGRGYYSGVLLKGGSRAIVETACDNKDAQVNPADLTAMNDIAAQLTVTPE